MRQTTATIQAEGERLTGSRILVVDDDVNLTRLLRAILRTSGFEVVTCGDSTEGLTIAENQDFNLIILDLRMPVMDGRTFYRELRQRGVKVPVVIASAYGARAAQAELGAQAAIEKPFDPDRLIDTVNRILTKGETA
ncbi:MAG: response regulator [Dehalococcoidia bacterium]